MRSYVSMNRMNSISRPAISGFNFSCLQCPKFDQIDIAGKEDKEKDWDKNRFRYRRKQAYLCIKNAFKTVCIWIFRKQAVFLWGISSVGRASDLQSEGRRFETCMLHQIISLTDRTLRYERRDVGSTVSSVDSVGAKRVPPARSTLYGLLAVYTATIII